MFKIVLFVDTNKVILKLSQILFFGPFILLRHNIQVGYKVRAQKKLLLKSILTDLMQIVKWLKYIRK